MHPTHTAVGREGETPMAPDRWPAVVPARPDGFYRAGRRPRRPHPALPGPGRRVAGRPGGVRPRRAGSWWVRGRVAFDAEGTCGSPPLVRNGLGVLTRDGDWHVVVEDPREDALASFVDKLAAGTATPEDMLAAAGPRLQFPTSVCFAGQDLRTAYVGSLGMSRLPTFRSPVPGLPMRHWS